MYQTILLFETDLNIILQWKMKMKRIYKFILVELFLVFLFAGAGMAADIPEASSGEALYTPAEVFILGIGLLGLSILIRRGRIQK